MEMSEALPIPSVRLTVKDQFDRRLDGAQSQSGRCGCEMEKETGEIYLFIYLFICSSFNDAKSVRKGKNCKGVPVHAMKACRESRGIPPLILYLVSRQR
jgi:hypothetical protein